MILSGGEFGVQLQSSLEMGEGFFAAIQHCQKKPDLVLDSSRISIKRRGLLPGLKCRRRIAARARRVCLGLQFAELRLLGGKQPSSGQQEEKEQAGGPAPI
jgi:hypothetical protein